MTPPTSGVRPFHTYWQNEQHLIQSAIYASTQGDDVVNDEDIDESILCEYP
eukprot:CAMPEP_0174978154 /NCGR_PEP_ID=MMETSP0004_2-20121128/14023_1 /TAXON_ID=420556 /ORGANISM="Ochromonas sp., Strain CCMP1393" /LENGTH=50 /DNA_ID=CAMNT_0016229449 /DNA_START=112 /DNA_END=261 /DNA_ORIENTATION=-